MRPPVVSVAERNSESISTQPAQENLLRSITAGPWHLSVMRTRLNCAPAFGGSAGMNDFLTIPIATALSAISVALLSVALFWL